MQKTLNDPNVQDNFKRVSQENSQTTPAFFQALSDLMLPVGRMTREEARAELQAFKTSTIGATRLFDRLLDQKPLVTKELLDMISVDGQCTVGRVQADNKHSEFCFGIISTFSRLGLSTFDQESSSWILTSLGKENRSLFLEDLSKTTDTYLDSLNYEVFRSLLKEEWEGAFDRLSELRDQNKLFNIKRPVITVAEMTEFSSEELKALNDATALGIFENFASGTWRMTLYGAWFLAQKIKG